MTVLESLFNDYLRNCFFMLWLGQGIHLCFILMEVQAKEGWRAALCWPVHHFFQAVGAVLSGLAVYAMLLEYGALTPITALCGGYAGSGILNRVLEQVKLRVLGKFGVVVEKPREGGV